MVMVVVVVVMMVMMELPKKAIRAGDLPPHKDTHKHTHTTTHSRSVSVTRAVQPLLTTRSWPAV